MDTIRIAGAMSPALVEELLSPANRVSAPEAEIRTLADWELALAGGGEDDPSWP